MTQKDVDKINRGIAKRIRNKTAGDILIAKSGAEFLFYAFKEELYLHITPKQPKFKLTNEHDKDCTDKCGVK